MHGTRNNIMLFFWLKLSITGIVLSITFQIFLEIFDLNLLEIFDLNQRFSKFVTAALIFVFMGSIFSFILLLLVEMWLFK